MLKAFLENQLQTVLFNLKKKKFTFIIFIKNSDIV